MSFMSQQARMFRIAHRDNGGDVQAAREAAGWCDAIGDWLISETEARLLLEHDAKNPPPPEAFELVTVSQSKEDDMASAAKKEDGEGAGVNGEYKRPDAAGAIKIYRNEIAGKKAAMSTIKGDMADPFKRIKDDCHFPRKILDFLFQLEDMEDHKRDHWLLAMRLGMDELGLFMPTDLVTLAQGEEGGSVVRARPKLVGVPSDGTETDLADAADFDEASEEELAAQKPRQDEQEKREVSEKA